MTVFHRNRLGIFLLASALFALTVLAASVAQAATITVVNLDDAGEGLNDPTAVTPVGGNPGTTLGAQRLNAFQHAANIWGSLLSSPVIIQVGAKFDPLPCIEFGAILGSAGPLFIHRDFAGAPVGETWYPKALANALQGVDLLPGFHDISATFNSAIGTTCPFPKVWYYGLDANPADNQLDFVTVVLHELGHGLGFSTVMNPLTGEQFLGFNDVYMLNLEDHGASPPDFPSMSDAQRLAASTNTGNLHWVGPAVRAASAGLAAGTVGDHVRMYAPNPSQPGSSVAHWDTALVPNQIMEPSYTGPLHDPVLELPLLQDIGWTLVTEPGIDIQPSSKDYGTVFVGATSDQVFTVQNTGSAILHVSATSITNLGAGTNAGEFSILGGVSAFDLAPDGTQQVTVRFAPTTLAGGKSATLRFASDDPSMPDKDIVLSGTAQLPGVAVVATDAAASEAGTNPGTFTVSRTGPTTAALSVNYTVTGTATSGSDYSALAGTVTIPAGSASAPVVVTPIDDAVSNEGNETVVVTLAAGAEYTIGAPSSDTVTIADNDSPVVTVVATDAAASEAGTDPGTFTVSRTGPTTAALSVNYTVTGTATSGSDYSALAGTVTIPAGSASAPIVVTPIDDAVVGEGNETVVVTLAAGAEYTIGAPSSDTVTIADNDSPVVTVVATDAAASEAGTNLGTFTVSRTGLTTATLTANYTVTGTATSGSDYTALAGSVTIAAGSNSATITVTPINDTVVETDETVVVTLSPNAAYVVGTASSATVTITDNDRPTVTIAATDATATEAGANTGAFTVTRTAVSPPVALTVHYTVTGTATSGSDYTALAGSVTIAAGSNSATITVTPINDTLVEAAETVVVTLSPSAAYVVGAASSATVTITDNDRPTVTIAATDGTATEAGATTGTFTVTRTAVSPPAALTVNYAVTGTATSGSDYTALAGSVTITAGSNSATITVTPINDTLVEAAETVVVTLSPNAAYVVGAASSATVTITDNDRPTVTIAATDGTATEAGATTGTFTVTRTAVSPPAALTVNYAVTGTATSGSDYTALAGSVTITAGSNSATITVTPIDDTLVESAETVVVTLSPNAAYVVGAASSATVTITDNDRPTVTIAATDGTATEAGATTGTFTVTRTAVSPPAALTVNYAVTGTATSGSDYTALAGSVTITAGSNSATITVTPIDDTLVESAETVVVTLSPSAAYVVGAAKSATVTISSND